MGAALDGEVFLLYFFSRVHALPPDIHLPVSSGTAIRRDEEAAAARKGAACGWQGLLLLYFFHLLDSRLAYAPPPPPAHQTATMIGRQRRNGR